MLLNRFMPGYRHIILAQNQLRKGVELETCEPPCPFSADDITLKCSRMLLADDTMAKEGETLLLLLIEAQGDGAEEATRRLSVLHAQDSQEVSFVPRKTEEEASPTSVLDMSEMMQPRLVAAS